MMTRNERDHPVGQCLAGQLDPRAIYNTHTHIRRICHVWTHCTWTKTRKWKVNMREKRKTENHLRATICQISYLLCVRSERLCALLSAATPDGAAAAAVETMTTRRVFRAFRVRRLYPKATHEIVMIEKKKSTRYYRRSHHRAINVEMWINHMFFKIPKMAINGEEMHFDSEIEYRKTLCMRCELRNQTTLCGW